MLLCVRNVLNALISTLFECVLFELCGIIVKNVCVCVSAVCLYMFGMCLFGLGSYVLECLLCIGRNVFDCLQWSLLCFALLECVSAFVNSEWCWH